MKTLASKTLISTNSRFAFTLLPQGIYVLKLITANGTTERKMLKQ